MIENLEFYRRLLRVSRHRLDDELETHAELMEQISSAVVQATTAAVKAKDELARTEARLSQDFKEYEPSLTVAQVSAKVARSKERMEAHRNWLSARELQEQWEGMRDAWKTRGYNIRNLSDLFASQYFALKSTGSARSGGERSYEERKQAMREATPRRRVIE